MSGEALLPAVRTGGLARLTVTIPHDAALVDLPIHNQALVPDPGTNPLGIVMSNGGAGRIGLK